LTASLAENLAAINQVEPTINKKNRWIGIINGNGQKQEATCYCWRRNISFSLKKKKKKANE
jgi:hypothetical protein